MSIEVENNLKDTVNKELFEQRAHFMPCDIEADGPADVQRYFETYVQEKDNGVNKTCISPKLGDMSPPSRNGAAWWSADQWGTYRHCEELKATFRGRPLDGVKMGVPEGYRAVVVTERMRPLAEHADRRFQVTGGFKEFIYWNYDKVPSKNDSLVKAMDWIDIADAIHGD